MYILITSFAISLFLLALFFAVKEREVYSGTETVLTRLLRRWSPGAERIAHRAEDYGVSHARSAFMLLYRGYEKVLQYLLLAVRAIIVLLAEKMIQAVRGEKLLSSRSTSSMYLKHLKEHKDNIGNGRDEV
ncbi:MAG: hypothetical protein KBD16_01870 [Candidatus Pacebacteria bacterium]|nr:hypothetical protein [Candidatus Paceibacterota bacterium]